jgi:hypothetical protein
VLPEASTTPELANVRTTVPAEHEPTVTVKLVPAEVEGVNTQPVAVPVLLKSEEVNPVIASENSSP